MLHTSMTVPLTCVGVMQHADIGAVTAGTKGPGPSNIHRFVAIFGKLSLWQ